MTSPEQIVVSHKIRLNPNNKQKTYLNKAFGCARLAYNWGLAQWQKDYQAGQKPTGRKVRDKFNAIRRETFPFTYEVSKYATAHAFEDLQSAFRNFFAGTGKYPKFKRRKDGDGSFYLGNDQFVLTYSNPNDHTSGKSHCPAERKHQYIKIPKCGCIRMAESLRFNGKINCATVSVEGDNYYVSISVTVDRAEYERTHPRHGNHAGDIGIDLGVKEEMSTSEMVTIKNHNSYDKRVKRLKRLSRQLDKRVHARTKQDREQGVKSSNNYIKLSRRLRKEHQRIRAVREDHIQKVTTVLTDTAGGICIEDLDIKGMMRKAGSGLARRLADVSMREIRREIEYKCAAKGTELLVVDRWYPSSKTCSCCGSLKKDLTLRDRVYRCDKCGLEIDRDLNAAINLKKQIENYRIGQGVPKSTPVDLDILRRNLSRNCIATKDEAGR